MGGNKRNRGRKWRGRINVRRYEIGGKEEMEETGDVQ
jgi:hypothetical protein